MVNSAELVFVRLTVPLIAGILLFSSGAGNEWLSALSIAGAIMLLAFIYINVKYTLLSSSGFKLFTAACFYVFPFLLGGWLSLANTEILQEDHFSRFPSDYLKVQVIDEPQLKNDIVRLKTRVLRSYKSNKRVTGQLLVSIKIDSFTKPIKYGDRFYIPGTFQDIPEPRNPHEFDVKNWYKRQNLHQQIFTEAKQLVFIDSNQGNPLISWALIIRKDQVELFRKLLKQDEANAVASTLILGYRADLSEDTLNAYAKTGTIHALSVSGMHVGIIYLVINFLLSFLDNSKPRRVVKLFLALTLIWLYAIVAGLAPSILRSAIMLSVFIIGNTFKQHQNSYNLLCFSAFWILIYNPFLIYDVGFQLSYFSVFGLIAFQPLIYAWFHFDAFLLDKLWSSIALSLAAQLSTFPLAMYYFHQFPAYFLFSNLFILLPVSLIMYVGLVIILARMHFLAPVFEWLITFTNEGLRWISKLPYASISGIWMDHFQLAILSICLTAGVLAFIYFNKKLLFLCLAMCCMLLLKVAYDQHERAKQKRIIFFSLRNSAAIAFIYKDRAWLLSDHPQTAKNIKYFVIPALEQSGVQKITQLKLHERHKSDFLQLKDHQLTFFNYKLMLADTCFNHKKLNNHMNFDAINVTLNSRIDLDPLLSMTTAGRLIIDGSIATYRAEYYENVANNFNIPVYNLKIKKAYLINLNKQP